MFRTVQFPITQIHERSHVTYLAPMTMDTKAPEQLQHRVTPIGRHNDYTQDNFMRTPTKHAIPTAGSCYL